MIAFINIYIKKILLFSLPLKTHRH